MPTYLPSALIAAVALGAACALLSVLVVLRRWAFIGEGIAHAGFGGVGTAWLVSLAVPVFAEPMPSYLLAVVFCLATAGGIGYFSRRNVETDTAIGIFLAAALAWGFLAQQIYSTINGASPPDWEAYLVGDITRISMAYALAAAGAAAAIMLVMVALGRQIVAYGFDPAMAEVSGVRAGFIHYLLIGLLALTIVLTMKLVGPLLVTALLVLPGATALQLSRRLGRVVLAAVGAGVVAALAGPLLHAQWRFIPPGPAMALVLLVEFLAAWAVSPVRRSDA